MYALIAYICVADNLHIFDDIAYTGFYDHTAAEVQSIARLLRFRRVQTLQFPNRVRITV